MKIVAKGRTPQWFSGRVVKCSKCECVVEMEETDNPLETGSPIYIHFPCPECGTELRIYFGARPPIERQAGWYGNDVNPLK